VTFTSLRDAGAKRLTDAGARLLDAVVATPDSGVLSGVRGAGRRETALIAAVPAIECDLAGGSD